MSRTIIALILAAVIVAVSVVGIVTIKRCSADYARLIDSSVSAAQGGDFEKAQKILSDTLTRWQSDTLPLSVCTGKQTLDEITAQLIYTLSAANKEQSGSFFAEAALLKNMFDDLYEDEQISLSLLF